MARCFGCGRRFRAWNEGVRPLTVACLCRPCGEAWYTAHVQAELEAAVPYAEWVDWREAGGEPLV